MKIVFVFENDLAMIFYSFFSNIPLWYFDNAENHESSHVEKNSVETKNFIY